MSDELYSLLFSELSNANIKIFFIDEFKYS